MSERGGDAAPAAAAPVEACANVDCVDAGCTIFLVLESELSPGLIPTRDTLGVRIRPSIQMDS